MPLQRHVLPSGWRLITLQVRNSRVVNRLFTGFAIVGLPINDKANRQQSGPASLIAVDWVSVAKLVAYRSNS